MKFGLPECPISCEFNQSDFSAWLLLYASQIVDSVSNIKNALEDSF
jgi:hypothetical protein